MQRWRVGSGSGSGSGNSGPGENGHTNGHTNGHRSARSPARVTVPGIQNLGNTCFFNAILQALSSTESFGAYLAQVLAQSQQHGKDSVPFAQALSDCITHLAPVEIHERCTSVVPKDLNRQLCSKLAAFRGNKQQDSQELLQFLVNLVYDEQQGCTRRDGGLRDIFSTGALHGTHSSSSSSSNATITGDGNSSTTSDSSFFSEDPVPMAFATSGSISDLCFEEALEQRCWNPLHGLQVDLMLCSGCRRYRPMTNRRFLDVSLSFGDDAAAFSGKSGKRLTLWDCLRRYTAPEVIAGVECSYCTAESELAMLRRDSAELQRQTDDDPADLVTQLELLHLQDTIASIQTLLATEDEKLFQLDVSRERCRALRDYHKRLQFSRCPEVFCFHFNRKVFHYQSGTMRKLDTHVVFPLEIDMAPFCRYQQSSHHDPNPTGSPLHPNGDTAATGSSSSSSSSLVYELVAVVLHHGNDRYGHFTAFRRVRRTSQWFFISDNSVRDASEDEVLASCAYMLFYERKCRSPQRRGTANSSKATGHASSRECSTNGSATRFYGMTSSDDSEEMDEDDEEEDDEDALAHVPDEEVNGFHHQHSHR